MKKPKTLTVSNLRRDNACPEGRSWVAAYTGIDMLADMANYRADWVLWLTGNDYAVPAALFRRCAAAEPWAALEYVHASPHWTPALQAKLEAAVK